MIICPLHFKVDPERLEQVVEEMRLRGAPILKGYFDGPSCSILLKEGTHRINAAYRLGVVPTIVTIHWWSTPHALINARIAAQERGLHFIAVYVRPDRLTA